MNNFKVLENLNQNTSLIIIDETTIALDDRFFAYYRGKYEISLKTGEPRCPRILYL